MKSTEEELRNELADQMEFTVRGLAPLRKLIPKYMWVLQPPSIGRIVGYGVEIPVIRVMVTVKDKVRDHMGPNQLHQ
jgi:hypothetical protein